MFKLHSGEAAPDKGNKTNKTFTPIQYAAYNNYWGCVEAIVEAMEKTDQDDTAKFGCALLYAVKNNKLQIARQLIRAGADMNYSFIGSDNHILHVAAENNHLKMIALLLEHKADLTVQNEKKMAPIHLASREKNWDCVELIAQTCYTNKENDQAQYKFALVDAVNADRYKTAKLLLEARASALSIYEETHNNSLHLAVNNSNPKMYALLLAHGADPSHKNKEGLTPLELAEQKKSNTVQRAYNIRHTWNCYIPLQIAIVFWQAQRQYHKLPYQLIRRIFMYLPLEIYDPYGQLNSPQSREALLNKAQDQVTVISARLVVKNYSPSLFGSAASETFIKDLKAITGKPINTASTVLKKEKPSEQKREPEKDNPADIKSAPQGALQAQAEKIRVLVKKSDTLGKQATSLLFKYHLKRNLPPNVFVSTQKLNIR